MAGHNQEASESVLCNRRRVKREKGKQRAAEGPASTFCNRYRSNPRLTGADTEESPEVGAMPGPSGKSLSFSTTRSEQMVFDTPPTLDKTDRLAARAGPAAQGTAGEGHTLVEL